MRQALILAGGKGTRLASRLNGAPKPLIGIDGVPLLGRQLSALAAHGFDQAVILVNHRAEAIEQFCADVELPGLSIVIRPDEAGERGTAGAVSDAQDLLAERFLVLYGDTLFDVDLDRLWSAHVEAHERGGAVATLFLHPNDHPYDSDLVELDDSGWVRAFHPKTRLDDEFHPNMVNAALYVLERKLMSSVPVGEGVVDFGMDLFPRALAGGERLRGYVTFEYIKDVGTPDRLDRAEADLRSGKVARCRLASSQRAVFLDRDGTLNRSAGHISRPEQLELVPGAGEAVARLNKAEYRCILVTNQPVLARGECSADGLGRIQAKLETLIGRDRGFLDATYICPHHPDRGFPGEVAELKVACACRKPAPGLIMQAIADLGIEPSESWMIGDSAADIGAAKAAGVRSILVRTGGSVATMLAVEPDYELDDISEAAEFIVQGRDAARASLNPLARQIRAGQIVRIAGQSRIGKSVLAACLREMLGERGLDCLHLRLDRWLKPHSARSAAASPRGNFDWVGLTGFLSDWAGGGRLQGCAPGYAPPGASRPFAMEVQASANTVLILDGTLAAECDLPGSRDVTTVFVTGVEARRRERLLREYVRRGFTMAEAEAIHLTRMERERPIVEAQQCRADIVIAAPSTGLIPTSPEKPEDQTVQ